MEKDFITMDINEQPSMSQPAIRDAHGLIYAGFWIRFYAKMVDWIICGILVSIFPVPAQFDGSVIIVSNQLNFMFFVFLKWCIPAVYTVIFLVNYRATPGKMAFSLQVIPAHQHHLTYGMALARFLSEILSTFFFFAGYVIAIFDTQKRTLHDRLCHTYVVKSARVVHRTNVEADHTVEYHAVYDDDTPLQSENIYKLHSLIFSLLVLESLFSGALCMTDDSFFRIIKWGLNAIVSTLLFFALVKQRNSTIPFSIRRLTWIITGYYCILTPIVYMATFLIGLEQFLHELPLIIDDPIVFFMQIMVIMTKVLLVSTWPQLVVTLIFIPCSFVLGLLGIILVSSNNSQK